MTCPGQHPCPTLPRLSHPVDSTTSHKGKCICNRKLPRRVLLLRMEMMPSVYVPSLSRLHGINPTFPEEGVAGGSVPATGAVHGFKQVLKTARWSRGETGAPALLSCN